MPLKLAQFYIEYLTEPGQLVVDPCAGWMTTGKAAQITGRRWLCTELMGEYVLGAASRFKSQPGFEQLGSLA
jgi:site-specific DNA-methyltransferase (cytosine-N4-specific)